MFSWRICSNIPCLHYFFADPVMQRSSQLLEFHGMMKQQQQVLELQKEMKQLRETRRISAEGLVKGSPAQLESAYQAKIGELQRTLQNLLQQRQKLQGSEVIITCSFNSSIHRCTVTNLNQFCE